MRAALAATADGLADGTGGESGELFALFDGDAVSPAVEVRAIDADADALPALRGCHGEQP